MDANTGEVRNDCDVITPEHKDAKKAAQERMNRIASHYPLGNFVLCSRLEDRFVGLKPQDVARLIYLGTHANYGGVLMVTQRRKMTRSDLSKVLSLSSATTSRFWSAVHPRYVGQEQDGTLTIKYPLIRGKKHTKHEPFTKIFIDTVKSLYTQTPPSKHGQLGYLFRALPFINKEFNILSLNPDERDLDKVTPMPFTEFCKVIGYDQSQASRLMSEIGQLEFDVNEEKQCLLAYVTRKDGGGQTFTVVNPRILYAGTNYKAVELLGLFFRPERSTNLKRAESSQYSEISNIPQ